MSKYGRVPAVLMLVATVSGCAQAQYEGVVRPASHLKALAPELKGMTDEKIEQYLNASVQPTFPVVLAVAHMGARHFVHRSGGSAYWADPSDGKLVSVQSGEAKGWRKLAGKEPAGGVISQVQFLNTMLTSENPTLTDLRHSAAMLHARILLVYRTEDNALDGLNSAAMAYWTIVGLFCVPGHTVGNYALSQGLLVDTRTGMILATVQGESKKEENVLPGAVRIARERTTKQATEEALARLQKDAADALTHMSLDHQPPVRNAATK